MTPPYEEKHEAASLATGAPRALTLLNLLLLICFIMPFCGVFGVGKTVHASSGFYCVAIFPNLVLGFVCTWIMWQSLKQVVHFFSEKSPALVNGVGFFGACISVFLIVAMLTWCAVTMVLAEWMNSTLHRWIA